MNRYQFRRHAVDLTRPIVFKSGCFDFLHIGHVRMLQHAAEYGKVYVGVGSDATVKALKGLGRPRFSQEHRVEMVRALHVVHCAMILTEPLVGRIDHAEMLAELRPDFWSLPPNDRAIEEKKAMAARLGIKIIFKDEMEGISSTAILEGLSR